MQRKKIDEANDLASIVQEVNRLITDENRIHKRARTRGQLATDVPAVAPAVASATAGAAAAATKRRFTEGKFDLLQQVQMERKWERKQKRTYIIGDLFCPHPVILAHLTPNTVILIAQTHRNNNL